jgi:starch synthase
MNIWLPFVEAGSGVDVFTRSLALALRKAGHHAIEQKFPHLLQYAPWFLSGISPPTGTDIVLANSWNGFAFARPGCRLVTVEHHCIFDWAFLPHRSKAQSLFHETLVRRCETASFRAADAIVAVSRYTADSLRTALGVVATQIIHNGVDTHFFSPADTPRKRAAEEPFRLLFVGNLSRRKGADLLLPIMRALGEGYELRYTSGLRGHPRTVAGANLHRLSWLDTVQLREQYRQVDLLLLPSRLEGFGYAAMEAMACGTPVVASSGSSLPELVADGVTGSLCSVDDVNAFARAIRRFRNDARLLERCGLAARDRAEQFFTLDHMSQQYLSLFKGLLGIGS